MTLQNKVLISILLVLFGGWIIYLKREPSTNFSFGWTPPSQSQKDEFIRLSGGRDKAIYDSSNYAIQGNVDPDGDVYLWRALGEACAKFKFGFLPYNQGSLGSCVGFGNGCAMDISMAVDWKLGKTSKYMPIAEESIYGLARNEGQGRISHSFNDGSSGHAAAIAMTKYGAIYRQVYPDFKLDLSKYNINLCRDWGGNGNGGSEDGLNGPFDKLAKTHPAKFLLVNSAEDARNALHNGWGIAVCSNQGFSGNRDADGFSGPQGSWSHCMSLVGYRGGKRPAFCVMNSWAIWNKGGKYPALKAGDPEWMTQPDGSFWADWDVVNSMLRGGDSFAVSGETGFIPHKLNNEFWN